MFTNSLDKKPLFKKPDGQTIRDLTQSMFDFREVDYTKFLPYRVPREYIMRPDLISQAVYNTTLYAEIILKYNGISNPLTINVDDVIVIPNLDSAKQNVKVVTTSAESSGDDQIRKSYKYIDPTKFPKRDENLQNFDQRDLDGTAGSGGSSGQLGAGGGAEKKNITDGALPPNLADAGATQISQRNGRVYFGEGIGESACLKNGMSSSEFLTQVIKSNTE